MSKYDHSSVEKKLQTLWEKEQTYAYQDSSKKETFVIDTPPPTVSGSLHIGHIFSYTQTDILARWHRMNGKNVFYPMGWDDNGLPTEKRSQELYGIKCDPKLNYDPHFKAQKQAKKNKVFQSVSRKNFLDICHQQVLEDEVAYKKLWMHIALSVDWKQTYRSISPRSQVLSQISFLDLYNKKYVENWFSPVLWDTQFQTAVAQADIEDREQQGFYHDIEFSLKNSSDKFTISTTRPELLPACVAVSAHPEDDRYKKFFGQTALSPLFYRPIPIIPSSHADPEKGTGILMICTYGDMEDVAFCKKHKLPILQIINEEGFFRDVFFDKEPFLSEKTNLAVTNYSSLKGLRVKQARKKIVDILKENHVLKSEPKACLHNVKFYEKGDFPLEILPKRQWYIKVLDHKKELLEQGQKIKWHPPSMKKRYEQWVEGLNQNWCISRQRAYGVPFPVWYPIDDKGQTNYDKPILPDINKLLEQNNFQNNMEESIYKAVEPLKQIPPNYTEEQRDKPGGFKAEADVMDTWASSSLTPYITSGWLLNPERHKKLFPADLRPQAHEIIRTWAFYSIVKAYFHEKQIPWKNIAISGWVVTPERMKMSKSKGNALEPDNLIKTYSADAVRYWSAKARLGQDTIYDENLFKTGKRLVVKIFNASRFVQMQVDNLPFQPWGEGLKEITTPIDQAWLVKLLQTKTKTIHYFKDYKHTEALELIEKTFWDFCDNYLELTKGRVYQLKDQSEGLSGKRSLDYSLYLFLKMFAPYLPYVTEEVWGERYKKESSSLHNSLWLDEKKIKEMEKSLSSSKWNSESLLETAFFILEQIRSQKSDLKKSLASPLKSLEILAQTEHLKTFELCKEDLARASHISLQNITLTEKTSLDKPEIKIQLED